MSKMDIFNLEETLKEYKTENNEADLNEIVDQFKGNQFENVLAKTDEYRKKHEPDEVLKKVLLLLDATCYAQMDDNEKAAEIINSLYQGSHDQSIDDLILFGNIAFMCDLKLSRRIMSDAVKQMEEEESYDQVEAARAYLVLGEAEENLEKFKRAIKYYKQGLAHFQQAEGPYEEMVLFLNFKLGALHSQINELDEAINYLEQTIEMADESNQEVKINSLVSMAKMYGNKDQYEKAINYLHEAIPMLEDSSLSGKFVHAEACTEMAYNYFAQSKPDEAVPYYEKAIDIHLNNPNFSYRELGMIYMQYAYCLENQEQSDKVAAGKNYEKAIEQLEQTEDYELLENALGDTIAFFESTGNQKKKRFYENKFVKLTNEKARMQ
ncbi:tetratricopeptide repeat protein [Alkalibacillus aidingensis]|uniref:tetratricopeptide repeat protein n=1 Tax=Alkalibacillus aidingensis TaxID=2747607 RepID=UPI001660B28E|nr:tetratricopeptide repeat protein [Alkalibacillus aidingensis]